MLANNWSRVALSRANAITRTRPACIASNSTDCFLLCLSAINTGCFSAEFSGATLVIEIQHCRSTKNRWQNSSLVWIFPIPLHFRSPRSNFLPFSFVSTRETASFLRIICSFNFCSRHASQFEIENCYDFFSLLNLIQLRLIRMRLSCCSARIYMFLS